MWPSPGVRAHPTAAPGMAAPIAQRTSTVARGCECERGAAHRLIEAGRGDRRLVDTRDTLDRRRVALHYTATPPTSTSYAGDEWLRARTPYSDRVVAVATRGAEAQPSVVEEADAANGPRVATVDTPLEAREVKFAFRFGIDDCLPSSKCAICRCADKVIRVVCSLGSCNGIHVVTVALKVHRSSTCITQDRESCGVSTDSYCSIPQCYTTKELATLHLHLCGVQLVVSC